MKKPGGSSRTFALLLGFICVCSVLASRVVAYEVRDDAAKWRRIEALYKDYRKEIPVLNLRGGILAWLHAGG